VSVVAVCVAVAVVARSAVSFAGLSAAAAAVGVVVDEHPGSYRRWSSAAAAHGGKRRRASTKAVEGVEASGCEEGEEGEEGEGSPSVLSTSAYCLVRTTQPPFCLRGRLALAKTGRE